MLRFPPNDRRRRATDSPEEPLELAESAEPVPMAWYAGLVNVLRPLWLRVLASPAEKTVRGGLN